MSHSPEMFTLSCRESGDEERTDLEMRSATKKYTIGSVDAEYAERIVACVNACRQFTSEQLAMMANKEIQVVLVRLDEPRPPIFVYNKADIPALTEQRPTEPAEKV